MRRILSVVAVSLFAHLASAGFASGQTPGTGGAPAAPAPSAPAAPPAAPPAAAPAPAAPAAPPAAPTPAPTPPAATPPAKLNLTATPPAADKPGTTTSSGATLSPNIPTIGGDSRISPKQAEALTSTTSGAADEWKFDFHGYFRAPIRVSFGPPSPVDHPSTNTMGPPSGPPPGTSVPPYPPGAQPPFSGLQLHSPPRVPGGLYTTWEFTNTVHGPWTQLNFSYGNSRAMATVIVDSYSITDGGYRHLQSQQGIDQAFLTLNFPEALGDLGTLTWNIGTFQNRYGTAGRYDGGMYETYLFGRTHMSGETLTANLTNLDNAGNWALTLEHGLGAKIEIIPFLNNQNYQIFTNVPAGTNNGQRYLSDRDAEYLPYAGTVPQGSTFVHHAHVVAKYQKMWTFGAHYLYTWTPDDNWSPVNSVPPSAGDMVPRALGPIQGSMAITGVEARLNGGVYGYGYLGWSHIDARNINALADAIEVVHSYGGNQFKQNYFGRTFNAHTGVYQGPQNETGTVDNISFQYQFSFGALARHPEDWWGDGPDVVVTGYGLLSIVDSKAPPIAGGAANTDWDMSTKKLKFGFDAIYTPLYWLGFNGRFDFVQPDLDAAYAKQGNPGGSDLNFGVLTARLVFKTQFVTHETVQLQYSHYFLGDAAYPGYPYAWVARADADLIALFASMWW
jgi:hypothetical protein